MARRLASKLAAAVALIFALLAVVFCALAMSSREWAVRDGFQYDLNTWNWTKPEFTLYRSPFAVCYATANSTTKPFGFNSTCVKYRPSGFRKTSCESAVAMTNDTAVEVGDQRQCQQIHLAGDFGITSVIFITLGLILTVLLALATVHTEEEDSQTTSTRQHEGRKEPVVDSAAAEAEFSPQSDRKHHSRPSHHRRSMLIAYLNLTLLAFLGIGIITSLISQYYAIEGLVQSAPNNADFASDFGTGNDKNTNGNHGPWYQGKALNVYMTCSWGFALAAGVIAARVWRLPDWDSRM